MSKVMDFVETEYIDNIHVLYVPILLLGIAFAALCMVLTWSSNLFNDSARNVLYILNLAMAFIYLVCDYYMASNTVHKYKKIHDEYERVK